MITQTSSLSDFFADHRERLEPLVLATIIETIGSTYRKPGAHMLIAGNGEAAGLLSGGCAESDLIERAQRVLATGRAEIATFDTRGSDDVIWGIGLGCEGAMKILLSRLDADNHYQPFAHIEACRRKHEQGAYAIVVSVPTEYRFLQPGQCWIPPDAPSNVPRELLAALQTGTAGITKFEDAIVFSAPVELPPRMLVLGAGADAVPVVELAGLLGWQTTVVDHRAAYAVATRFARATRVVLTPAADLEEHIDLVDFDAAVVMSHHLPTDEIYLKSLARSAVQYVGLLGPPNRRQRLIRELGSTAQQLDGRLAGPVGLDIGARTPEAIALAIVAEIHAHLEHRTGASFSGLLR